MAANASHAKDAAALSQSFFMIVLPIGIALLEAAYAALNMASRSIGKPLSGVAASWMWTMPLLYKRNSLHSRRWRCDRPDSAGLYFAELTNSTFSHAFSILPGAVRLGVC